MSSRYLLLLLFGCAGILGYANARKCMLKEPLTYEEADYCTESQPHLGCNHNQVNQIRFNGLNSNKLPCFTEIRRTLPSDSQAARD